MLSNGSIKRYRHIMNDNGKVVYKGIEYDFNDFINKVSETSKAAPVGYQAI